MPTPEQIEEDAKLTPEERAAKLDEAKAAFKAIEPAPASVMHTYPDGSARIGQPPFPELSPIQEAESKLERVGVPADPVPEDAAVKRGPGRPPKSA